MTEVVIIGFILLAAFAAAAVMYKQRMSMRRLRASFGPEYHRLEEHGQTPRTIRRELREREHRVAQLNIVPLTAEQKTRFTEIWKSIQARFVERFGSITGQQIEIHDVGTLDLGGGWALDGGWFVVTATTPDGPMAQEGTYMNLVRQQPDGTWKIHWAVSNGHMRPAGERG